MTLGIELVGIKFERRAVLTYCLGLFFELFECRAMVTTDDRIVGLGETDEEHKLTLLPVYCLGLCANGPAVMLDGQLIANAGSSVLNLIEDAD